MINNVAAYILPQTDNDEHGAHFVGVVGEIDDEEGVAALATLLPKNWEGKYTPHLLEIRGGLFSREVIDFAREHDLTHLALLEGPNDERKKDPFYFADTQIANDAVVCWYRAAHSDFFFFHCPECASLVLSFIVGMQEVWYANRQEIRASNARN